MATTARGTLRGGVYSPTGAPLAGAEVTLSLPPGAVATATTNFSGVWTKTGLLPGSYAVAIAADGFAPATATMTAAKGQTLVGFVNLSPS